MDREQIARDRIVMCRDWIGQKFPGMDSGDKVEMAVALDELLEAREQAAREPLRAQIAALVQSLQDCLDFIYSVGADSPSHPHKDAATLICEAGPAMRDSITAAREHDEAIERAAFEAGRDAAHDAAHDAIHKAVAEMVECNRLKNEVCAAIALVSPPAQETG